MSTGGRHQRRQVRGVSIVELMIGITIGLFILAGASMVMTNQLGDNRRLLLETQMQQDLRSVATLISRDVRRANYYGKSYLQVWTSNPAQILVNPYNALLPTNASASTSLQYARSLDDENQGIGVDDDAPSASELVGFSLNSSSHAIEMQLGTARAQALTDPNVLRVTDLSFTVTTVNLPVPCGATCPVNAANCALLQRQRQVTFVIVAEAVHDSRVRRSIHETVRLRNDRNEYAC